MSDDRERDLVPHKPGLMATLALSGLECQEIRPEPARDDRVRRVDRTQKALRSNVENVPRSYSRCRNYKPAMRPRKARGQQGQECRLRIFTPCLIAIMALVLLRAVANVTVGHCSPRGAHRHRSTLSARCLSSFRDDRISEKRCQFYTAEARIDRCATRLHSCRGQAHMT